MNVHAENNLDSQWFGKIPSSWELKKVYELFDFPNKKVSDEDFEPLSVTYGGIKKQMENVAKTENGGNRKFVDINDIVINGRSDRKGAVGLSEYQGSVSLVYHSLRSRTNEISPRYYHHLFRSKPFSDEFFRWGRGIVDDLWTTRQSEMKRIAIPVPPLDTQDKIASFLDKKIDSIDKLIARKSELIARLEEKYRVVLTKSVTLGTVEKVTFKKVDSGWIEAVPEHWTLLPLKYLFVYHNGGVWGDEPLGDDNDVICVRVADFNFLRQQILAKEFTYRNIPGLNKKLLLNDYSILLEKSGGGSQQPVGRAVRYVSSETATCSNFIEKLEVNIQYNPAFVTYLLAGLYFLGVSKNAIKQTTGIQNLDLGFFLRTSIYVPPLLEQDSIVTYLNGELAKIVDLIEKAQTSIDKLIEYRSALIYAVTTGKVKI